jgi:hypothetical protein
MPQLSGNEPILGLNSLIVYFSWFDEHEKELKVCSTMSFSWFYENEKS